MSIFSAYTRRKFLRNAAAGAGAAAAASVLPRSAFGAQAVPPGKKLFNDIDLTTSRTPTGSMRRSGSRRT